MVVSHDLTGPGPATTTGVMVAMVVIPTILTARPVCGVRAVGR
jgi:hypothetical protein